MLEKTWNGITFRVSLLFPAVVIVLMSCDTNNITSSCLIASFLHEAGHVLAMLIVHDRPRCVTMGIFGICIERDYGCYLSYRKAVFVSLAGPLVNVLCFTLFWWHQPIIAIIHGGLGFFNLLPIVSLDGGEALYAVLCLFTSEQKAACIMNVVSLMVIVPMAALGFCLLVNGRNFTLLVMSAYLLLLFFLKEKH